MVPLNSHECCESGSNFSRRKSSNSSSVGPPEQFDNLFFPPNCSPKMKIPPPATFFCTDFRRGGLNMPLITSEFVTTYG